MFKLVFKTLISDYGFNFKLKTIVNNYDFYLKKFKIVMINFSFNEDILVWLFFSIRDRYL